MNKLFPISIAFILLLLFTGTGRLFCQNPSPGIAWRKVDWAHYDWLDNYQTQKKSGEDWWYSGKPVYQGSNLIGYVAVGYTGMHLTTSNIHAYNSATDGCSNPFLYINPNLPLGNDDCADRMVAGSHRKGAGTRGNMAFLDIFGNQKWCYTYAEAELEDVIAVSDGFIAIGYHYAVRQPDGFEQYYNPTNITQVSFPCYEGSDTIQGVAHFMIVKTDFEGNTIWSNIYGADGTPDLDHYLQTPGQGWGLMESSDGNIIGVGKTFDPSSGKMSLFVVEVTNADGYVVQKKMIYFNNQNSESESPSEILGRAIVQVAESPNVYVVGGGVFYPADPAYEDWHRPFLMRLDEDFEDDQVWASNPDVLDIGDMPRNGMITDLCYDASADQIIVPALTHCTACAFGGHNNLAELQVYFVNPATGDMGGSHSAYLDTVQAFDLRAGATVLADGNYVIVSSIKDKTVNDYSTLGAFLGINGMSSCATDIQTNFGPHYWDTDAYVTKLSPLGSVIWSKQFDCNDGRPRKNFPDDMKRQECLYRIVPTPDNGMVIFGNSSHNFDDYYSAKIFSDCQLNASFDIYDNTDGIFDISTNITWNANRTVKGIIRINSGSTLTIDGATIEFADSRRIGIPTWIEVRPNAQLIIQNGAVLTSYQGCDEKAMWDGIKVWGPNHLAQNTTNQGKITITESTVENAYTGVSTFARFPNGDVFWEQSGGGIVVADQSTFKDNSVGFEFVRYHGPLNNYPSNISSIRRSNFMTTSDFGNDGGEFAPYAFIITWGTNYVKIEGNDFVNYRNVRPDWRGSGIITAGAALRIMPYCSNLSCTSPVPNTFTNLFEGVLAYQGNQINPITIDQNIFSYNVYGVRLIGSHLCKVTRNSFNLLASGNPIAKTSYGIFSDDTWGLQTQDNEFYGDAGQGHVVGTVVMNSSSTGSGDADDYRNDYHGLTIGSHGQGLNDLGYQIDCNRYYSEEYTKADIFISHHDLFPGIMADQGICDDDPEKPQANEFYGTCNNSDRYQIYTQPGVFGNTFATWRYRSYPTADVGFDPGCTSPNEDAQECMGETTSEYNRNEACPSRYVGLTLLEAIPVIYWLLEMSELEIRSLEELIDDGDSETVLEYIEETTDPLELFDRLLTFSPYLSDEALIAVIHKNLPDTLLDSIMVVNSSLSPGVMNELNAYYSWNLPQKILDAQDGTGAMTDLKSGIKYYQGQFNLAVSALLHYYLDSAYVDSAVTLLRDIGGFNNDIKLVPILMSTDTLEARNLLDSLYTVGAGMFGTSAFLKGLHLTEYCKFHLQEMQLLSDSMHYYGLSDSLRGVWEATIATGAPVGASAQFILDFLDRRPRYKEAEELIFPVAFSMPFVQHSLNEPVKVEWNMRIFPNPAKGQFTVRLSSIPEHPGQIGLFSIQGVRLQVFSLPPGQQEIVLDAGNLPAGIYIINYINADEKYLFGKLVVDK